MPPKSKFAKEDMVKAALSLVREQGAGALTARHLAARLGTSVQPIFRLFSGMEEVRQEVLAAADACYQAYLREDMARGDMPPYKASGMAYIRFAKEEKELFKLLFMRDRTGESIAENREEIRPILEILQNSLGLDEDTACRFHLEMWLYTHGIATMVATSYLEWDTAFVSAALTDAYQGLICRYSKGDTDGSH